MALAETFDLPEKALADVVSGGPLDFPWIRAVGSAMATDDFGSGGSIQLALKDVRLARDAVEQLGLDLPLNALVAGRLARAVADGATVQPQLVKVSRRNPC